MEDKPATDLKRVSIQENQEVLSTPIENISQVEEAEYSYMADEFPEYDEEFADDEEFIEDEDYKEPETKSIIKKTKRIPIEDVLATNVQRLPDDIINVEEREVGLEDKSPKLSDHSATYFMDDLQKNITFHVIRDLFVKQHKHVITSTRFIKMTEDVKEPFIIVDDGVDYTPKRAIDISDPRFVSEPLLLNLFNKPYVEINTDDFLVRGKRYSKHAMDLDSSSHKLDAKIASTIDESDEIEPSVDYSPQIPYKKKENIDKLRIVFKLQETETITILELTSIASDTHDEEGKFIKHTNALCDAVNKRLRKKMNNYCQTTKEGRKRIKGTQLSRKDKLNKFTFSCNWDYYDSLNTGEKEEEKRYSKLGVGRVSKIIYAETESTAQPLIGENFIIKNRLQWYKMGMITERLLLSNNAQKRQLVLHDLMKSDPLSSNVQFKYNLHHLWSLRTSSTEGMAVTCMTWHQVESNILAVGYGKFHFTDKNTGIVCIWNNKNLAHPEREFKFAHSVTSIKFSSFYPNILAISCYSGWVMLVNIVKQEGVKIIARNMPFNVTSVTPVWDLMWKILPNSDIECICECTGAGYVNQYTRRYLYEKQPLMKISKMKSKVKGIYHPKKCQPYVIPLVRNPAILCIAAHPGDPNIYFLGTDEGGVYKCTVQDVHQYLEMFLAHNGPVYIIQFHPACSKIFLTCGADWCIRIWADGIFTPLLTMSSGTSCVQHASWSPIHPTIIIGVIDTLIELWDISRRIALPQAVYENPNGKVNTFISFSKDGETLCVGDRAGNIHVYILSNMPFTPSNSDMVLALILIKALVTNRKLLAELYKLGSPFNVSKIYRNFLNL